MDLFEILLLVGILSVYTINDIDNNIDYFNKCYQDGLSAYKALLFFFDYLQEIKK